MGRKGRESLDVSSGGKKRDFVTFFGYKFRELKEGDYVTESKPWEHSYMKLLTFGVRNGLSCSLKKKKRKEETKSEELKGRRNDGFPVKKLLLHFPSLTETKVEQK
ncbi:hypothetical protein Tco_0255059 [Tanacetum coccineum]